MTTPKAYANSLGHAWERDYALAYLRWLREETDSQPWEGDYGLGFKLAQTIRRRLGTLTS